MRWVQLERHVFPVNCHPASEEAPRFLLSVFVFACFSVSLFHTLQRYEADHAKTEENRSQDFKVQREIAISIILGVCKPDCEENYAQKRRHAQHRSCQLFVDLNGKK